jgi:hypothetical protein
VVGVTELLAALDKLGPYTFTAATVTVYAAPVVRPVIVIGEVAPVALTAVPSDVLFAVAT